jgi:hypothetical protein
MIVLYVDHYFRSTTLAQKEKERRGHNVIRPTQVDAMLTTYRRASATGVLELCPAES